MDQDETFFTPQEQPSPQEPPTPQEPRSPAAPASPVPPTPPQPQDDGTAPAGGSSPCGGNCSGAAAPGAGAASGGATRHVYAIGRIETRFPSLSVEKEVAQAMGRGDAVDLTDRQALFSMLNDPQNRCLARQMCFVLTIQGLETYLVLAREPAGLTALVEALGPAPRATDRHVDIGARGPIAPSSLCNGLALPLVLLDQLYAFDVDSLVGSLPKPDSVDEAPFRSAAEELFERVLQMTDNAGSSDEHRALNYLAVRYPQIYARTAEAFTAGQALTSIESRPSRLSGARKIIDILFSYTDRRTDVTEKFFVRVDVTEEFPFLVTKLSPYYDR